MDTSLEQREPRVYEAGYHLLPTLAEDDRAKTVQAIEDMITKNGGLKISEGKPEHVELAYPIDRVIDTKRTTFRNAYFGWIKFEIGPDLLKEIQEALDAHRGVLRHLIVSTVREDTLSSERKVTTPGAEAMSEPQVPAEDVKNPAVTEEEKVTEEVAVDEAELDAKLNDITTKEEETTKEEA